MYKDIVKPALILFVICVAVTFALAFTYNATKETIDNQTFEKALKARNEIFPEAGEFLKIEPEKYEDLSEEINIEEVYEAKRDGMVLGYIINIIVQGYGDKMVVVTGIEEPGRVVKAAIREHAETPGLGSKITELPFISQLNGITREDNIRVVKTKVGTKREEINAVTGATMSSKAVVKAVREALEVFNILNGGEI